MLKIDAIKKFIDETRLGISKGRSFGIYIPENKHGIINKVNDINNTPDISGSTIVAGNIVITGTNNTTQKTYHTQDKNGVFAMVGDDISEFNNDSNYTTLADVAGVGYELNSSLNSDVGGLGFIKNISGQDLSTADNSSSAFITLSAISGKANSSDVPLMSSGIIAPISTPGKIGDIFVDTILKKIYVATGNSSSADWTIVN